jgi:hypothetical protein
MWLGAWRKPWVHPKSPSGREYKAYEECTFSAKCSAQRTFVAVLDVARCHSLVGSALFHAQKP